MRGLTDRIRSRSSINTANLPTNSYTPSPLPHPRITPSPTTPSHSVYKPSS